MDEQADTVTLPRAAAADVEVVNHGCAQGCMFQLKRRAFLRDIRWSLVGMTVLFVGRACSRILTSSRPEQ
jgi:hypothetical protein